MKSHYRFPLRVGDGYSVKTGERSFIYITLKEDLELEILGVTEGEEIKKIKIKKGETYSFKRETEEFIDTFTCKWELGELIIKIKSESKDYLRTNI